MSQQLGREPSGLNESPYPTLDANDAVDADDAEPEPTPMVQPANNSPSPSTRRNAFNTLMSSPSRWTTGQAWQQRRPERHPNPSQHLTRPGRDGLGAYLTNSTNFGSSVLYDNGKFVAIKDMYPKSAVHLLLLPRTKDNRLHPFTAFQDKELLEATRAEALKVKTLAAEELSRLFGRFSESDRARRDAMASGADGDLPPGRDWEAEIIVGVHAGPSMNHLHVHILSRDRVNACVTQRKHYNSFNTSFFVGLDEFPLARDDPRWSADRGGGLREDMKCWRCGRNFGSKFGRLKHHLDEEFERWKKQ